MVRVLIPVLRNSQIGVCGIRMEARDITLEMLAKGVAKGPLEELTDWTLWSGRILDF